MIRGPGNTKSASTSAATITSTGEPRVGSNSITSPVEVENYSDDGMTNIEEDTDRDYSTFYTDDDEWRTENEGRIVRVMVFQMKWENMRT